MVNTHTYVHVHTHTQTHPMNFKRNSLKFICYVITVDMSGTRYNQGIE